MMESEKTDDKDFLIGPKHVGYIQTNAPNQIWSFS